MIQFRTVLLIQLHYEFSSRDIPGCQEFFLCDTCIQLTVRAAHALQDRVLTAAALFLFLCAVRYSDSPDFYHHQKLYQRNCVHTKNSGYPLSRHAYKWLLYKVQLCAFGGFGSHRLKAVNRTLYTALTLMHTSSRVQFQWIPCRIQARSPSSAPSLFLFMNHFLQLTILVTASIQSSPPSERGVGRTGDVQSAH